jgi:hypothetical protein
MSTLGKSQCGQLILDKYNSRNEVHPTVLKEAFSKIVLGDRNHLYVSVQLEGKSVGYALVIPAALDEDIIFAKRLGYNHLSRFVRGKSPIPTNRVSVELLRIKGSNEWLLQNSHYGDVRPLEIDLNIDVPTQEQLVYWSFNAFCWGYVGVIPGSITEKCPWEP